MFLHRAVRYAMIGSLALAVASWWFKDVPPPHAGLGPDMLEEPKQVRVRDPAFKTRVNGVEYEIRPRYSYDIRALVVSLHHSDTWWDYAHKEWNDHINLMDLCVVWGNNVRSGAYRNISFSNTQWECHWSSRSREAWEAFDQHAASNNHIVTDKAAVAQALKQVKIGDEVRIRGYLVDYSILQNGRPTGSRVSSEVRTDDGPGACEVLYVDDFSLLRSHNQAWRTALKLSLGLLALSLLVWVFLPVRFDD